MDLVHLGAEQLLVLASHLTLFFVLIFILFVLQRSVFLLSTRLFDGRIIYLSAWIGTPIHELSHAFFCFLFGHKIQKIVLFNPDQRGTLGYVTHSYNNRNLWQIMGNFFIGIAPLFGGLLALYLLTYILLDNAASLFQLLNSVFSVKTTGTFFSQLFVITTNFTDFIKQAYFTSPVKLLIWCYCCAAVSLHLSPSKEDLKGAWFGFFIFLLLCLSVMVMNQLLGWEWFFNWKLLINSASVLYVIGIVLASLLLFILFVLKSLLSIFIRS